MTWDPVGKNCLARQPGTEALMAVLVADYRTANSGTFQCRQIKGSTTLSFHAEGRAGDTSGYPDRMRVVADLLVQYAEALGVQEVIYDHQRWSTDDGTPGWEPFGGVDPHTSHVHWSLTWAGAKGLTEESVRTILGGNMPLTPDDLAAISKIVEAQILAHLGHLGKNSDGDPRKTTIVNAVVRGIEATVKPDLLKGG